MKSNHRPGAFARLEHSVKRYMNRRSQFAHELTGANISRTLAAELIIGSGIFSTAFFAQNVITGAALIIAGLLIEWIDTVKDADPRVRAAAVSATETAVA